VHHSHGVAIVDHRHDLAAEVGGGALGVVALGNDPVEELAAAAELHDEVNGVAVLVSALELHDVAVAGEVVHDLHLSPDILQVVAVDEFGRGDGFARELLFGVFVGHKVCHAELAAAQFAAEGVGGADVLHGPAQDPANGGLRIGRKDGDAVGVGAWLGMVIGMWLSLGRGFAVTVPHRNGVVTALLLLGVYSIRTET